MGKHLAIMTPIFMGSGTGAAAYYRLLVKSLAQFEHTFTVISEHATEPIPPAVTQYWGLWPIRTGKNKQRWRDIGLYGLQNLAYFRLGKILRESHPDVILIHSSFYNFPGFFAPLMGQQLNSLSTEQRSFIDVRDVLLPSSQMQHLRQYDGIITCSDNTTQRLIDNGISSALITQIPIPQEPLSVRSSDVATVLENLQLTNQPYLLYAGMVKEIKAVDLLLEAFVQYVRPLRPDLVLVVAGYLKTQSTYIRKLLQAPGVNYVGNQTRNNVQCLMTGARLCINLSPNEGLSRSSLEALALNCPALLPPNVPEFERYCPEFVVKTRDPKAIAERILTALDHPAVPHYPIENHDPERVVIQYERLFRSAD